MNKGLKISIILISILMLGGILVTFFTTPRSSYIEEPVEDVALEQELDAMAKEALKTYFDIEVNQSENWEKTLILNRAKENTGLKNVLSLSVQDKVEEKAQGTLKYYGIIVEEDTKELRGIIYDYVTDAPVLDLTDEEIQERGKEFLVGKGFVQAGSEMVVGNVEANKNTPGFKAFTVEAGDSAYYIGYNLQLDQVMYIEHAPEMK